MEPDRRYASRKFTLSLAAFLVGVVFYALHQMTTAEWTSFTTWIVGLYMGANVADQAVTKVNK